MYYYTFSLSKNPVIVKQNGLFTGGRQSQFNGSNFVGRCFRNQFFRYIQRYSGNKISISGYFS